MEKTIALYTNHIRSASSESLRGTFKLMLSELGFVASEQDGLQTKIFEVFAAEECEQVAAEKIWGLLGSRAQVVAERLVGRAELILSQVGGHVRGPRVLDFGCGDGRVSELVARTGVDVTMYDVDDYRTDGSKALAFDRDWASRTDGFDTALVVTVLHHCDDPEVELARLRKVARRIVVIESVVDAAMPYASQAVVDWIYNRGMHPGAQIPVPGQFRTAEAWRETFARHGFKVTWEKDLGVDLPVVPEHHHLFVCDRI